MKQIPLKKEKKKRFLRAEGSDLVPVYITDNHIILLETIISHLPIRNITQKIYINVAEMFQYYSGGKVIKMLWFSYFYFVISWLIWIIIKRILTLFLFPRIRTADKGVMPYKLTEPDSLGSDAFFYMKILSKITSKKIKSSEFALCMYICLQYYFYLFILFYYCSALKKPVFKKKLRTN